MAVPMSTICFQTGLHSLRVSIPTLKCTWENSKMSSLGALVPKLLSGAR